MLILWLIINKYTILMEKCGEMPLAEYLIAFRADEDISDQDQPAAVITGEDYAVADGIGKVIPTVPGDKHAEAGVAHPYLAQSGGRGVIPYSLD